MNEVSIQDLAYRRTITEYPDGTKVTVHVPQNVSENVRRQKINMIYDILAKNSP
jgi:hypothetical protein